MQESIYFISGLGADRRAFQNLELPNIHKKYIEWIAPIGRESLQEYARRISEQIPESEVPILLGLSFGGLIAAEIAKSRRVRKILLVSSVKRKAEIPFYYRAFGRIGGVRFLPKFLFSWYNPVVAFLFGVRSQVDKKLLKNFIRNTNPDFTKWALEKISVWENDHPALQTFHIHGDKDRLFPISNISDCTRVPGGGHFMISNRAQEISNWILEIV